MHLDQTKSQHNDNDYTDFVIMLDRNVTKANIAKMFGVSFPTIKKWIRIYLKETGRG